MKNGKQFIFALAALCAILSACVGSPPPHPVSAQSTSKSDELDAAIRETSNYLNKQLTKGNKLMILNVQSDFPAMSEYIIDELIANTVNDRVFSVVDRQQLDTIRAELDFQMSGEVDDKTAQALGRMAGAQIIISGAVSKIGELYRLRVRALSVQSAQIEGQFNKNIPEGPTVTALVNSKATGYGGSTVASGASGMGNRTPAPAAAPAPVQAYKIGDKGPAGGLICYDKGNYSDGWRYLEAAPADTEKTAVFFKHGNFGSWGVNRLDGNNPLLYGMTNKGYREILSKPEIGYGKQSSEFVLQSIITASEWDTAIQVCDELVVNGFDDWFLPSLNELSQMYGNLARKGLGGFAREPYWSSTAYMDTWALNRACYVNFHDGDNQQRMEMAKTARVRAMRQF